MIVNYAPADGEASEWEFRPRDVPASKAEMIERRAGLRFEEWANEVIAGSAKARRVLLWHLLTLKHPAVRFEDVPDFAYGELTVSHDLSELLVMRSKIEGAEIEDEVRAMALSEIDADIDARREAGDTEPGKA